MHILANSGWAWHLCAAPALLVARLRKTPVIINYRGGNADNSSLPHLGMCSARSPGQSLRVTPSTFLRRVFPAMG
jgi:hypothetical protein